MNLMSSPKKLLKSYVACKTVKENLKLLFVSNSCFQNVSSNNLSDKISQFEHKKFWYNPYLQETKKLFGKSLRGNGKDDNAYGFF